MANLDQFYDATLWNTAGSAAFDPAGLKPGYKTGLFHLVYFLLYTQAGRNYLHDHQPNTAPLNLSEAQIRGKLRQEFENNHNVSPGAAEALIAVHFAGLAWVAAHNASGGPNIQLRDQAEATFKQAMAAASWFMWEDGAGPLFPLGW